MRRETLTVPVQRIEFPIMSRIKCQRSTVCELASNALMRPKNIKCAPKDIHKEHHKEHQRQPFKNVHIPRDPFKGTQVCPKNINAAHGIYHSTFPTPPLAALLARPLESHSGRFHRRWLRRCLKARFDVLQRHCHFGGLCFGWLAFASGVFVAERAIVPLLAQAQVVATRTTNPRRQTPDGRRARPVVAWPGPGWSSNGRFAEPIFVPPRPADLPLATSPGANARPLSESPPSHPARPKSRTARSRSRPRPRLHR